jgi:ATP-dependent Clp protease ATP-binding subunit ClpA
MDELRTRPEFLNRIDEIVVFNHLTRIDIWEICELMIGSVQKRLKEKVNLIVELSVQAFLTDEGYDPLWSSSITSSNHEVSRRYLLRNVYQNLIS